MVKTQTRYNMLGNTFLYLLCSQRFVLLLPWEFWESHNHRSYRCCSFVDTEKIKKNLSVLNLFLDRWSNLLALVGFLALLVVFFYQIEQRSSLRPSSWKIHQVLNEIWSFFHFHISKFFFGSLEKWSRWNKRGKHEYFIEVVLWTQEK